MHIVQSDSAIWCRPQSFCDILFSWLRGVMHIEELNSAVWCTTQILNTGWMQAVASDSAEWCTLRSFLKILISRGNRNVSPVLEGSNIKIEVENLDTHPFKIFDNLNCEIFNFGSFLERFRGLWRFFEFYSTSTVWQV